MTDDLAAALARAERAEAELARRDKASGPPGLVTRPDPPVFRRSDLRDAAFFHEHRREILDAVAHGRIIDDAPPAPVPTAAERAAGVMAWNKAKKAGAK